MLMLCAILERDMALQKNKGIMNTINEQKITQLIPAYIDKIPLPLSMNGKISFTVFPKAVLEYALRGLVRFQKTDPEERARYLYGICKKYSAEQKVRIHFDWALKLKEQCNIQRNSKFTVQVSADQYKKQAHAFSASLKDQAEDGTATQPISTSHESNTSNENDGYELYKATCSFIARENRKEARKAGVDMEMLDDLSKEYREKRAQQSNTYQNPNVSEENTQQSHNYQEEKESLFARFSASRKEDPVIAYAKVYIWEQSQNYAAVNAKLNLPPSPFKKPEDISNEEGCKRVEAWRRSSVGQEWFHHQCRKGRLMKFHNPYASL